MLHAVHFWYGISGPPGMSKAVVSRISAELKKILVLPDVKQRFGQQGADTSYLPPDEFVAFMKAEWAKWGPVVKATGARADQEKREWWVHILACWHGRKRVHRGRLTA